MIEAEGEDGFSKFQGRGGMHVGGIAVLGFLCAGRDLQGRIRRIGGGGGFWKLSPAWSKRHHPKGKFYKPISRREIMSRNIKLLFVICFVAIPAPYAENFDDFISGGWYISLTSKEKSGFVYRENGVVKDPPQSLFDHGWNYGGVELWTDDKSMASLANCLSQAKRMKKAGLKIALNIFYSDNYKRNMPAGWPTEYPKLLDKVYSYTQTVLDSFRVNNVLPEMVKIGNEIDDKGGLLLPVGVYNSDNFYGILKQGCKAVKDFDPAIKTILHAANETGNSAMIQAAINNGIPFDIYAISLYPSYGGRLSALPNTLRTMGAFNKKIMVVETGIPWTSHDFNTTGNIARPDQGWYYNPLSAHTWYRELQTTVAAHPLGVGVFTWPTVDQVIGTNTSNWENAAFWNSGTKNMVGVAAEGMGRINSVIYLFSKAAKRFLSVDSAGNLSASASAVRGDAEKFEMVTLKTGWIALKSKRNQNYVTGSTGQLKADANSINDAQQWLPEDHAEKYSDNFVTIAFRSRTLDAHMEANADNNWQIRATSKTLTGGSQRFIADLAEGPYPAGTLVKVESRPGGAHGIKTNRTIAVNIRGTKKLIDFSAPESNYMLRIFTWQGAVISHGVVNKNTTEFIVSNEDCPPGVYLVELVDNKKTIISIDKMAVQ